MAAYSKRHYGKREWRLRRHDQIVLHYTVTSSYPPVFNTFAANDPALGEPPGVCAHYVVDKGGTTYRLVRPSVRCRHTIGLNHRTIGIEFVQEGSPRAEEAILSRGPQRRAGLRLAAWLAGRFGIRTGDVIGHAMANGSRFFRDRAGWRNDHGDWPKGPIREFRKRLRDLRR
jgi:N-acetyl-anhydromuramyl-L-alanine amidase AmpD